MFSNSAIDASNAPLATAAQTESPANAVITPRSGRPPARLRLLTLNIHKGFSVFNRRLVLHELRAAIRELKADVVCLQEVQGQHSGHSANHPLWPEQPQYEFLADSIWHEHAYGRNAVYAEGHHGNALLSKFPILSFDNHDVSIAGPERRGMLHCMLQLPEYGATVHVICVHLGLIESHRRRQMELICALIRERIPASAPLIVAGDFNDWRGCGHQILEAGAGLREVFVQSQGKAMRSYPARWPLLRLDRVYCRNLATATPVAVPRTPWSHLSDHVPLCVELTL